MKSKEKLMVQPDEVHTTIVRLCHRINDRFPEAGLLRICEKLRDISDKTRWTVRHIAEILSRKKY